MTGPEVRRLGRGGGRSAHPGSPEQVEQYDVVVVGGRVAGASTALLLARAGLRVAVVERSRRGTDTVSTHALMRAGVLQLSRWGVLADVVAAGTPPIRRTTFHHQHGEQVQVTIRPGAGVDALYAPRRHVLDRILVDAAVAAGAETWHRTTMTGLLRDPIGRVTGIHAVTGDARTVQLRAPVTVGADGIRSQVAAAAGAAYLRRGTAAGAVLYRYADGAVGDGYEWAYGHRASAGLIPTNDGRTCIFVATAPDRMRAQRRHGAEPAFWSMLDLAGPSLAERVRSAPVGRLHGWAGVPGFVRRPWGPGWALVGDAGYFKDPITTHGMTDAVRDAELVADAVLEVLVGGTPESVALSRYERTRDRLSADLFAVTEEVAAYDWDAARIQRLLRRVSSAMSDEVEFLAALPPRTARSDAEPVRTDTAAVRG